VEADVTIGPNAALVAGEREACTTIVIRKGAVLGANATVLAGIVIGSGAMVGAGAVVTRSVPPNAVVVGSPARIAGYVNARSNAPSSCPMTGHDAEGPQRRTGVGTSTLQRLKVVKDMRGSLSVGEFDRDIPFTPRRYFFVYDVPSREARGEHAHKVCHQFLICVRGSCGVMLDDGRQRREFRLDRFDVGIHIPPLTWGTQYRYSPDGALLVFASHYYDDEDYIRTYDEFREIVLGHSPS
jgi:hypothetical protein